MKQIITECSSKINKELDANMNLNSSLVYQYQCYNQLFHHKHWYTGAPIGEGGVPLDQPLSVAVNIEYTLDERKFVDLESNEPALIINPFWKHKPVSTSTPKKKYHRNKLVRPHASLPFRSKPKCGNQQGMTDLLGMYRFWKEIIYQISHHLNVNNLYGSFLRNNIMFSFYF